MFFEKLKAKIKVKSLILIAVLLLLSVISELLFFMCDADFRSFGTQTVVTEDPQCILDYKDCVFDGENFVVTGAYPHMVYSGLSQKTSYFVLKLKEAPSSAFELKVSYWSPDTDFIEVVAPRKIGTPLDKLFVVRMPGDQFTKILIRINENVKIDSISLMDSKAFPALRLVDSFNMLRVLIVFAILSIVVFLTYSWWRGRKKANSLDWLELCFLIGSFVFFTMWNTYQYFDYAPDERMRMDVTFFLYENNRLPVGDELTHYLWGFSYAHMPTVLCNILGYLFMLLATPFTTNTLHLIMAARMVSVLAGTGTVYFVIKSSKLLFNSPSRWIMIVATTTIPQFAFLSSYVNNDILAVFGTSIIFYTWVRVLKGGWNYKLAALLSAGLAVCATSYYNSYGWILVSVVFCAITYFKQNPRAYKGFFKMAGFVTALTVAAASYLFIRHLVLYGDLLGMKTGQKYGELFAADGMKPSERQTIFEKGVSLGKMLFGSRYSWVAVTAKSFVAVLGYMANYAPRDVFAFYQAIVSIGVISLISCFVYRLMKRRKIRFETVVLYASIAAVAFITVFLSIYNSYFNDFQPQGRYCYPALIPIALVVSRGIDLLIGFLPKKEHRLFAVQAVCSAFVFISIFVFKEVFVEAVISYM